MKRSLLLIISLLFVISCGSKKKNQNNAYLNALNSNCGGAYGNFNNFQNNYQYGQGNPYQLAAARMCGQALLNNCYGNTYNSTYYDNVRAGNIEQFVTSLGDELYDVHGIVEPQNDRDAQNYYNQVGFTATVNTGNNGYYNYGYNNPYYGNYAYPQGGYGYQYCDQLQL